MGIFSLFNIFSKKREDTSEGISDLEIMRINNITKAKDSLYDEVYQNAINAINFAYPQNYNRTYVYFNRYSSLTDGEIRDICRNAANAALRDLKVKFTVIHIEMPEKRIEIIFRND